MKVRAAAGRAWPGPYRLRLLAALVAAACSSDPAGGGEILVVSQIDVQPPGATVVVGGTQQLTATPKTSSGITVPNRTATWSSEDQGIATVSPSGLVTGVAQGSVLITARVDDITRDVTVNVTPRPVASVSVEPSQASIPVGGSQQLLATPRDAQGQPLQNRPVTYSTDNPSIATVSGTGIVVGVAIGATTIRATAEGKTGTSAITVTPRPAARLAFTTHPSDGIVGQALAPIRVTVQDELGGTVTEATTSVTLSMADNAAGATLGGTTTMNAVAGIATFSSVTLDKSGTGYTIRASATALSPAISNPFTISAGTAARLAMLTQPSATATSGAPLAVQPVVGIIDANGNPVSEAGVQVSVQLVGVGATLGGVLTVPTEANGTATFSGLSLIGATGSYSLRFVSDGLVDVTSSAIALSQGTATRLGLLTPPSSTAQSGVPFPQQPVIQLRGASNNPVAQAGVPITVAVAAGGGTLSGVTTLLTNSSGQAAFSGLALTGAAGGGHALVFTSPGLAQVITSPITLTAGPVPTQLAMTTQPSATAANGAVFAQQPAVQLRDVSNNAVSLAGVPVTATIASGGGTLLGTATVNTDASGVATFTNLAISGIAGPRTIQFTSAGLTPVTSGTVTITAGAASRLGITTQPSAGAASGVPFAQQPVVQITDASGNAVAQAGTAVTATIEAGAGGNLHGTTLVVTNASGQAAFTNLALVGASGVYTLRFSASGLTHVISSSIGLGAGAPTKLAITTQPSASVQNGVDFPVQPAIQLQDAGNNPVAQAGVQVTVTIQTGDPDLSGTLSALTNASGLATFTNLRITGLVGNRTLIFASSGLVSIASGTIAVTPGAPDALSITTQPSAAAQSGIAFAQQPVIRVVDQSGNNVSQAGINVTASIASGGGTLGGTATVATNGSGIAAFSGLSITGLAGVRTLGFGSGGLDPATSSNITLSAGNASQLAITTAPSGTATNGTALGQQPQVQIQDGAGNPVAQNGVLITAAIGAGSPAGALTNATATTNASGLATFSGLTITGTAGSYTLQFTSGSLTPVTSGAIVLGAGSATQLSITTAPGAAAQSGIAISPQPAIQLRDLSGNAVSQSGVTINAAIALNPGGTLANASASTNGSGLATFSGLAITGLIGGYTLEFSSGGLTAVTSGTITLSAGNAATLTVNTEPSDAQVGAAFPTQPVIRAVDGAGNNVTGAAITAAIASGPGGATLGGTATVATDAGGLAAFTNLSITGTTGVYTLQFTSPGASAATSQAITLSAGAAARLAITTQPAGGVQNDVEFPTQPVIQVTDAGGNPLTDDGIAVTAGIASGGGTLGGTTTVNTVSGVATFTDLKITGTVGTRTLAFGAPSLVGATSGNVVVSAGALDELVQVVGPSLTANDGIALAQQPTIGARDISGNPIAGISIDASVTGGWTLGGSTTVVTDGSGNAVFSGLAISGPAGAVDLTFAATGADPLVYTITLSAELAAATAWRMVGIFGL